MNDGDDDQWPTTQRAGQVWNFPIYDIDRSGGGHQDIALITCLVVESLGYPDGETPSQSHRVLILESNSDCANRQPGCVIVTAEPAYRTWDNASSYTRIA